MARLFGSRFTRMLPPEHIRKIFSAKTSPETRFFAIEFAPREKRLADVRRSESIGWIFERVELSFQRAVSDSPAVLTEERGVRVDCPNGSDVDELVSQSAIPGKGVSK